MDVRIRAQMSAIDGQWCLYVIVPSVPASQWPEREWDTGAPVPTLAQRRQALAGLGFELVCGEEWQWFEQDADDPSAPVRFIAMADVQEFPHPVAA
ncbi:DUF6303 family protein [Streptomyces sp. NPDC057654]|uniref:DUF6303 family protein n=1 Tax=Streptomyces sp. NPDC057654 TaxID=3346196 RepID=UPI0036A016CA